VLGESRERVLAALEALLDGPEQRAAEALLLPPATVAAALSADRRARTSPTVPALRRYAGTVYDGLASVGLDNSEQRLAARSVMIFSGLFGVVRGDEPVPDYRVPAKAVLPGIGVAATFWRPLLDTAVPALLGRGPVVDLRSSDYAAMWRPKGRDADRMIRVRVLSPLPKGGSGVVSYPSKYAKGRLAAALVRRCAAGRPVRGPEDVVSAWLDVDGPHGETESDGQVVLYTG
jgi:hypothetical protein